MTIDPMEMLSFSAKTALVVGGAGRLGSQFSGPLAGAGDSVSVTHWGWCWDNPFWWLHSAPPLGAKLAP